ncbi:MAG: hypothetical protein JSV82_07530 [Planctomycetota bacterium]|nr:MAG: hypothetical protein JSV82_07530 [Planctomycetota bacterium]
MQRQNIIRLSLFVVFFSIGAAALSGSVLCCDLLRYYRNRQLLKAAEESLEDLTMLNADYDALLGELQSDPNVLKRIAPATLGTEPAEPNTVYPKASDEQLAAARRALAKDMERQLPKTDMVDRLARCSGPAERIILFLAGAFLILISFVCFGPAKQPSGEK